MSEIIAPPDQSAFILSLPEVPYGFILPSRTFWGAESIGARGSASLTVKVDDQGNLLYGKVLLVGGVPDRKIPDNSLLMEGDVVEFLASQGAGQQLIQFNAFFRLTRSHAKLAYQSPLGVWNASVLARPPLESVSSAFKIDWQGSAPLNSYVGQVRNVI